MKTITIAKPFIFLNSLRCRANGNFIVMKVRILVAMSWYIILQEKKRKMDILACVNRRHLMLILLMLFKSSNFQYSQFSIVYRINKT